MTAPAPEGKWTEKVRRTAGLMGRARSVLAYGGLDGVVQRPLFHETGTFPQFAESASGCRITDSTGNVFIDWANGWGPVFLGYRAEAVERAIVEQLSAGPTLSLMHPLEVEVAERLCSMIPTAEMVVFGKNGSDVVSAALRVARAATGRDMVLQHGFHGFHEWHQVQNDGVQGIPRVLRRLVDRFDYGDLDGLERLLRRRRRPVAAVIMEPTSTELPPPGYLEGVRELTERHGALLIFDEMVTAFRVAPGGAQELYGVEPDLTCIGKAMGNGMPIAALVGRREFMQHVPAVGYGMTFRGETLSLAAADAVLTTVETEPVVDHLAAVGTTVRDRFEPMAAAAGLPCRLLGHPTRMTLAFDATGGWSWEHIRWTFLQECLRHGVMSNGTLLASYAHDPQAVDETLDRLAEALVATRARLDGPTGQAGLRPTGGSPFGPRVLQASGFLEQARVDDELLHLGGWLCLSGTSPTAVQLVPSDGDPVELELLPRPDVDRRAARPLRCGFTASVPAGRFATAEGHELILRATGEDGTVFSCPVVLSDARESSRPPGPWSLADGVLYV